MTDIDYTQMDGEKLVDEFYYLLDNVSLGKAKLEKVQLIKTEIKRRLRLSGIPNHPEDFALLRFAQQSYFHVYTGSYPFDWSCFANDIKDTYNITENLQNREVWKAVMRKAGRGEEVKGILHPRMEE